MKIARIVGAEDVRNVQMQAHAGGGSQMIPFAESFNESMTAIAIKPGDLQRELPDGDAALQGNEGMKQSGGERPGMAHLFEEALAGISAGSKKGFANEGADVSRSGGASSGEEAALKDRLKDLVKKTSAKVETGEVRLDGKEASPSSAVQQKDASAAGKDPANANNLPSGLKDALMADLVQGMSQEKVHASKEDHRSKETIKTHQEGVQHKASKKEEAVGVMATALAASEMPVATETNASVVTASPVPVTSLLITPKDLPVAGDGSLSPAIAVAKSVREATGKTLATQKKSAPQVSLEPLKTNGGPKQSIDQSLPEAATETGKGEERPSVGLKKNEDLGIAPPLPEKNHLLPPQIAVNMVSTEMPIHSQGALTSLPEKAPSVHTVPADAQVGAAAITPQLYEADAHKMLAASPTSLEVGVPGGTHGWLKVRAELAGDGVVHASVSSSSLAGTEMLRRELPSLTSYLHQEQLQVSSVVVHASSSGMDGRDFAGGGQGHDPGQGTTDPQGGTRQESGTAYQAEDAIHSGISNEMDEQDSPLSAGYAGGGGWLSIRA